MKIIILGAGAVGSSIANILAGENNDISVVDTDIYRLRDLQDRLDIKTVNGVGSHPGVLRAAGAEDADMLIAVTSSDETNMVACQVAYTLFRIPTKIARIRSSAAAKGAAAFSPVTVGARTSSPAEPGVRCRHRSSFSGKDRRRDRSAFSASQPVQEPPSAERPGF